MKRILFLIYYISISTLIFSQSEISELFPTLAGLERTYYIYSPYDCTSDRSDNSTTPTKIDTIINDKSYLFLYECRKRINNIQEFLQKLCQHQCQGLYILHIHMCDKTCAILFLVQSFLFW